MLYCLHFMIYVLNCMYPLMFLYIVYSLATLQGQGCEIAVLQAFFISVKNLLKIEQVMNDHTLLRKSCEYFNCTP